MEWSFEFGPESEVLVNCQVNVVDHVECHVHVTPGWLVIIYQEEGMQWCKVGMSACLCQPPCGSNNTLVFTFAFKELRRIFVFI